MKKTLFIILLIGQIFAQGNDRFGSFISSWYDTMLMLTDTTYSGNSGQWIQDGRGNLTNIFLDYTNGRVGIGTGTPSVDLEVDGAIITNANYVVEGYSTNRVVLRSARVKVAVGGTPNTNINITATDQFNHSSTTNATDLAKGGTSGAFELDATGKLILMNITETVLAVISSSFVANHDINSSTTAENYFTAPSVSGGNIQFRIYMQGGGFEDWTALMDAGDDVTMLISYLTST